MREVDRLHELLQAHYEALLRTPLSVAALRSARSNIAPYLGAIPPLPCDDTDRPPTTISMLSSSDCHLANALGVRRGLIDQAEGERAISTFVTVQGGGDRASRHRTRLARLTTLAIFEDHR